MHKFDGLNLELTTCCPLHCPQCYCTLEGGKHLDLDVAKQKLKEASEHGVKMVHLSGGETMCYPHLYELIEYASSRCEIVNVALSGYKFNQSVLHNLIDVGVNGIFISLNGSTKEINSLTRDGFELAINALRILQEESFTNTYINWVMHSNNCDDFPELISLAEKYNVANVVVLSFKPDSKHQLESFPNGRQIKELSDYIKYYHGSVKIMIESCFSQLLAVHCDTKLFGNLNVGSTKGCRAGMYVYSINVDGLYSPCRHLDYFENFDSLDAYIDNSKIIRLIRSLNHNSPETCINCHYSDNCRSCLAVNSKIHSALYLGNRQCDLWK